MYIIHTRNTTLVTTCFWFQQSFSSLAPSYIFNVLCIVNLQVFKKQYEIGRKIKLQRKKMHSLSAVFAQRYEKAYPAM